MENGKYKEADENNIKETYLRNRENILKIRESSEEYFDKVILTLDCATLGWLIVCVSNEKLILSLCTERLAWAIAIFLFASIFSHLSSFWFARENADKKIAEADNNYKKQLNALHSMQEMPKQEDKTFWTDGAVRCSNMTALITFAAGMACLLCFVFTTINNKTIGERTMSGNEEEITNGKTIAKQEELIIKEIPSEKDNKK
jgi:hypothetical protein